MRCDTDSFIAAPPGKPLAKGGISEAACTRPLFLSICFYLLSQAYAIPVVAIGPSWAIWPTLSDFAAGLILVTRFATKKRDIAPSQANIAALRSFTFVFIVCAISYLVQTILLAGEDDTKPIIFGGFALYRLIQFIIVFWGVSAVPFTPFRRKVVSTLSLITFLAVCAGIMVTYFSIIPSDKLIEHLPSGRAAGPWLYYTIAIGEGIGLIGYNHSYVAAQVVMMLAISLHFLGSIKWRGLIACVLISLGIFACFLTGSRMGLITMLLYSGIAFFEVRPKYRFVLVAYLLLAIVSGALLIPWKDITSESGEQGENVFARNKAIFHAFERENLSGRDEIWAERLFYLNDKPIRWIIGGGFGSAADLGGNAHMQILQTVSELGMIGAIVWGAWFLRLLGSLWLWECDSRAIFWGSICLLVSCTSQETLYPVPALGHFLGLYMLAVGMALRSRESPTPGANETMQSVLNL